MKKNLGMIFGITLLGGGMCLAQSEPPSLAQLAMQNKTTHKEGKIFTEADLPSVRANAMDSVNAAPDPQRASNDAAGATGVSTEQKAIVKETGTASKDEPSVTKLKKEVESYQQARDTWQGSARKYEALLANETNDFRRQMYQDAIENDQKNVAFYQQKLDQAQSELVHARNAASSGSSGASAKMTSPI